MAALLAVAACGGKTDDAAGDAGNAGDAAADHATPADAAPLPDHGCPGAQPQEGTACATETLQCEYGNDPRWTCNWVATCAKGRWSVATTNDAWCPTPATNPAACPATFTAASQGGVCPSAGVPCDYAEGFCTCLHYGGPPFPDAGQPADTWACNYIPGTDCPAARPRLGEPCAPAGTECDYGVCDLPSGLSVQCDLTTHTWRTGSGSPCALGASK